MKIAVLGAGISGLGSAYILSKKHDIIGEFFCFLLIFSIFLLFCSTLVFKNFCRFSLFLSFLFNFLILLFTFINITDTFIKLFLNKF